VSADPFSILGLIATSGDIAASGALAIYRKRSFRRDLAKGLSSHLEAGEKEIGEAVAAEWFWDDGARRTQWLEERTTDSTLLELDEVITRTALNHADGRTRLLMSVALTNLEASYHLLNYVADTHSVTSGIATQLSALDLQIARVAAEIRLLGDRVQDAALRQQSTLIFGEARTEITVLREMLRRFDDEHWTERIERLYQLFNDYVQACQRRDLALADRTAQQTYLWFQTEFMNLKAPSIP